MHVNQKKPRYIYIREIGERSFSSFATASIALRGFQNLLLSSMMHAPTESPLNRLQGLKPLVHQKDFVLTSIQILVFKIITNK